MAAPVSTLSPTRQSQSPTAVRSKKADTESEALKWQPVQTTLPLSPAAIPVDASSYGEDFLDSTSALPSLVFHDPSEDFSSDPPETDPLEAEADSIAERVLRAAPAAHQAVGDVAPPLRRLDEDPILSDTKPTHVQGALRSPAQSLAPTTRALMEQRFGWNLDRVRIHTGPAAAESATALHAQAYTIGNHIVFAQDRLQPDSPEGQRLLAHELTHVTRQSEGIGRGRIQMQSNPHATGARRTKPKGIPFKVTIDHAMGPDELLRTFIRQYYHLTSEQEVEKKFPLWHWDNFPGRSATEAAVKKGGNKAFLILRVNDATVAEVDAMSKEERAKLNKETDERFWAQTQYKAGEKLGRSAEDQDKAREWLGVRADILLERGQLKAIQDLPEDIKNILFAGGRPLVPDDYPAILALADKLGKLTPVQRQDYLSKVNADTDTFSELDKSIDLYMLTQNVEKAEEARTEDAAEKLFGLEDLYKLYKAKEDAYAEDFKITAGRGYSPAVAKAAADADAKFTTALKQNHFSSEQEFLDAMEAYRLRFRSEAVHIALEVLARYEHMLFLARKKYSNPANATTLVKNIGASKAQEHYKEADDKASLATLTRMTADPETLSDAMRAGSEASELDEQSNQLKDQAESEVVQASGMDPLVDPKQLGRGTDREKLAGLAAPDAQQYLLQVINERYDDLGKARAEFTEDPDRIFSQPGLVEATKQEQSIGKDTIYAWIVDDYIADEKSKHLFTAIVLGIIAVILAILVPGGGWVAAAALVAGATISTVQAIQAIQEYQTGEIDYRLNFIQEEPSLAWVFVAVAAAALDMGMAASGVLKVLNASAAGIKELEAPLKAFSEAKDAETAAARLEVLNAKIDQVEGLQKEVKEAIKARAAAEVGLKKALGKASSSLMGTAGAVDPTPVFEAFYYGIKKGANTITKLRNEAKIVEIMGDVTKMTGATREEMTTAFEQVKEIINLGKNKNMDEATVLKYVDQLARQRSGGEGAFEVITQEMKAWRKPTAAQIAAEARLSSAHDTLASFKQQQADLQAELRAGVKTPAGQPDTERIAEIRKELSELSGEKGVDRAGHQYIKREGLISKAERAVDDAEKLAEKARLDPKTVMRRAFNASEERADTLKGVTVDQVGPLKTKPAALTVDHIVSIKQISEMEGFSKLTIKERNYLATLKDNLIVMDASANSSKGERTWAAWKQAGTFYDADTVAKMAGKDSQLRAQIQTWIQGKVKGR